MKIPTFRESYDKIVNAYLRDELKYKNSCACFVGNLLNNSYQWGTCKYKGALAEGPFTKEELDTVRRESNGFYNEDDIKSLECNFMTLMSGADYSKDFEHKLYNAMESTLLLLKEIHIAKGEVVEDYIFTKRKLELV